MNFIPMGSTSLPFYYPVGSGTLHAKGLKMRTSLRPGYAIEYDYFDPQNLKPSLETKSIDNLFLPVKSTERQV